MGGYQPIENYGVIGDCHTVALVGLNGSIDWLCFPKFDAPSVFGAILDDQKGGSFQLALADNEANWTSKQMYIPDTNILLTRFFGSDGLAELVDFMPVESDRQHTWNHRLVRRITSVRGELRFRMVCQPAFNYARDNHQVESHPQGVIFRSKDLTLGLSSDQQIEIQGTTGVCEFTLMPNETATFMLHRVEQGGQAEEALHEEEAERVFQDTVRYWRNWLSHCTYQGRWREYVNRSALVLKLLTFAPTGAIVAAPTTSLPEAVGQGRNWDYRYTWIRDASFTCYALLSLGFQEEAGRFMDWVNKRCRELDPKKGGLQIMYGIDGRHELKEDILDHLSGYKGSRPVRIGNAAYHQRQLDIYGELMDAVYLYNKYSEPLPYNMWTYLCELMNWLCCNWQKADSGLWEERSGDKYFVYSRFMGWVALDRALRIARNRGLPANLDHWQQTRDEIYHEVMNKGWSTKLNSFIQYYGSEILDASSLLMPIVKFMAPTDPRMISTLDNILKKLTYGSLVYRYRQGEGAGEGRHGQEGTFSLCSFWLVECLTLAGRLDEARLKLEKMFSYANHLGLYAEEIGTSGEMLGNYPQAFTHLGLISAVIKLDQALNKGKFNRNRN